ncbi:MAG: phosphate ABC transporter permease subunit PstC [Spirochaetaceae bacterium]|nr:phosphate ABC transporter permease subunit PstC [Spirochaetaceae bacterium]
MKKTRLIGERSIEVLLLASALLSIISVIFMTLFIFAEGMPLFSRVKVVDFLFGTNWDPQGDVPSFGIFPFIVGSVYVTLTSLVISVPIGLAVGIFMAEYAKGRFANFLRSVIELLAGIPSVIYGLFGYIAIAPLVRKFTNSSSGLGVFTGAVVLAIMVLPTIVNITEVSLRAVPREMKEGSMGVGASHWQTIIRILLPSSRSGIAAGIVLAMGRAIGETMAVLMVAGNSVIMPKGLFSPARTLTMNIATGISYASGDHWVSLFTTGMVLFIFILLLNISVQLLLQRSIKRGK